MKQTYVQARSWCSKRTFCFCDSFVCPSDGNLSILRDWNRSGFNFWLFMHLGLFYCSVNSICILKKIIITLISRTRPGWYNVLGQAYFLCVSMRLQRHNHYKFVLTNFSVHVVFFTVIYIYNFLYTDFLYYIWCFCMVYLYKFLNMNFYMYAIFF